PPRSAPQSESRYTTETQVERAGPSGDSPRRGDRHAARHSRRGTSSRTSGRRAGRARGRPSAAGSRCPRRRTRLRRPARGGRSGRRDRCSSRKRGGGGRSGASGSGPAPATRRRLRRGRTGSARDAPPTDPARRPGWRERPDLNRRSRVRLIDGGGCSTPGGRRSRRRPDADRGARRSGQERHRQEPPPTDRRGPAGRPLQSIHRRSPGAPHATANPAIRVADCVPVTTVTLTLSDRPRAAVGITTDSRAFPPTNDSVCGIAFPSTDGSPVNLPLVSGCPLSLRVTGKTIVNRLPLVATVGVTIGTAITGLTTTGLGVTGVRAWAGAAVNVYENDPSSGALSSAT